MSSRADSRPHPRFLWTSERVQSLPLSQKRMLDYLWTGPDVNGIGVTVIEPGVVQARVGELGSSVLTCLEMLQQQGFIVFDKKTMEAFVLDWFRVHTFLNNAGRGAYARGIIQTISEMLKIIAAERFVLCGHKLVEIVDKSTKKLKKQRVNLPTPTSTSTSTSTSPPPNPTSTDGGGEVLQIFLKAVGEPGEKRIRDELNERIVELEQDLLNASIDQAKLAGQIFTHTTAKGKITGSDAGLARRLCQLAAKGRLTKPSFVEQDERKEESSGRDKEQEKLADKFYIGSTGDVFHVIKNGGASAERWKNGNESTKCDDAVPVDSVFIAAVSEGKLKPLSDFKKYVSGTKP